MNIVNRVFEKVGLKYFDWVERILFCMLFVALLTLAGVTVKHNIWFYGWKKEMTELRQELNAKSQELYELRLKGPTQRGEGK